MQVNHTMAILQLSIQKLKHNSQVGIVDKLSVLGDEVNCTEVPRL